MDTLVQLLKDNRISRICCIGIVCNYCGVILAVKLLSAGPVQHVIVTQYQLTTSSLDNPYIILQLRDIIGVVWIVYKYNGSQRLLYQIHQSWEISHQNSCGLNRCFTNRANNSSLRQLLLFTSYGLVVTCDNPYRVGY